MKALYLECKMGCAGDMLMSALSELVDQKAFIDKMNALGIEGVKVECVPSKKCGILGSHIQVLVDGKEESENVDFSLHIENAEHMEHILDHIEEIEGIHHVSYSNSILSFQASHEDGERLENQIRQILFNHFPNAHMHSHGHSHHAHGMNVSKVYSIIQNLPVSNRVKKDAISVYELIAKAESQVHGMDVENVHFHEVGTIDALVDVVGNCMLMEMIDVQRIYCSPIALGNGMVKCAHGILPVPAPATAILLEGIPSYAGRMDGELCTPTGAALLKYFVDSFEVQPTMKTNKIGYGMGNKDFPAANCVRAFLGEMDDDGEVCELTCNLDDMTPEEIGFAYDILFANGALDVYVTSVHMKKNRPGYVFTCMCKTSDKEKMMELMFKHLSTLGIRESSCIRHALKRKVEALETPYGSVRKKQSYGYHVQKEKFEYEDLARIAKENGLSIQEIRRILSEKY